MKKADETYNNGQRVAKQKGETLTYYFENGDVKAQGKYLDGIMQGKWIFNKKEGYLWQVGHFDEFGKQHGPWVVYDKNGAVQKEKYFEHGKQLRRA
jgi:antitoxin component YwqK of YwqJK toxin-antitoxin module